MSHIADALIAAGLPVTRPSPSRVCPALEGKPNERQHLRIRAIRLLRDDGMTYLQISTALRVGNTTISAAINSDERKVA